MPEERSRSLGDRLFNVFLVAVFLVMAVELILLARQNRELKATIAQIRTDLAQPAAEPPGLRVGEVVEPLDLPTVSGGSQHLAYDDPARDTVLLIFSPDCPACQENLANWKRIQASHDPGRERLVYISTAEAEKTLAYAKEHGLLEPVLLSGPDSLTGYKVSHIPTTVVVGPGGVVKNVWVGVLPQAALEGLSAS